MAIQNAQAKLYNAFIASVVDKTASAALVSTFKAGHQDPNNPAIILDDIKPLRILRNKFEFLNSSSAVTAQGSFSIKGGVANLQTQGTLSLRFPTFVRIDIDKLALPEGRNVTLQLEEGWLLEDRHKFPFAFGGPLPANANMVTFRVPKKFISITSSAFTGTFVPLRIKQLSAPQFNSISSLLALPIFNPGKLAALFGGNFVTTVEVTKIINFIRFWFVDSELRALAGFLLEPDTVSLFNEFTLTGEALEGLQTTNANLTASTSLTADVNIDASINLVSNSFATLTTSGERVRFIEPILQQSTSSLTTTVNVKATGSSNQIAESSLSAGINYISVGNTVSMNTDSSLEQNFDLVAIYSARTFNENTASVWITNSPRGGGDPSRPPINATIFWGDGTQTNVVDAAGIGFINDKVYEQPGDYKISIRNNTNLNSLSLLRNVRIAYRPLNTAPDGSTFRGGFAESFNGLRSIVALGQIGLLELWDLFGKNLTTEIQSGDPNWFTEYTMIPDTLPVTVKDCRDAFLSVFYLRTANINDQNFINLSNWDVSRVENFSNMFRDLLQSGSTIDFGGSSFTIGQTWNTQSATNMAAMFQNTRFNGDLSNWCVPLIPTRPTSFSVALFSPNIIEPIWGTCP